MTCQHLNSYKLNSSVAAPHTDWWCLICCFAYLKVKGQRCKRCLLCAYVWRSQVRGQMPRSHWWTGWCCRPSQVLPPLLCCQRLWQINIIHTNKWGWNYKMQAINTWKWLLVPCISISGKWTQDVNNEKMSGLIIHHLVDRFLDSPVSLKFDFVSPLPWARCIQHYHWSTSGSLQQKERRPESSSYFIWLCHRRGSFPLLNERKEQLLPTCYYSKVIENTLIVKYHTNMVKEMVNLQ